MMDKILSRKFLKKLTTPVHQTSAFKLGLVNDDGTHKKDPSTPMERTAYTDLDKLVFSLKRIINKNANEKYKFGSMVSAQVIFKENCDDVETRFYEVLEQIESGVLFVEETISVALFFQEEMGGGGPGAPANSGGSGISMGGEAGDNVGTVSGYDMSGKLMRRQSSNTPKKKRHKKKKT